MQLINEQEDFWGEPIFSYSRAQGIEDGVLVDVTEYAKGYFKYPVAVTQSLWAVIDDAVVKGHRSCDYMGILHDIFYMMIMKIRSESHGSDLMIRVKIGRETYNVVSVVGPGDTAALVITIGFVEDF